MVRAYIRKEHPDGETLTGPIALLSQGMVHGQGVKLEFANF